MSEFGRRPATTRESLHAAQGASDGAGGWTINLPKPVIGLLGGFALVGLLVGVHVAVMKGFGRALDRHWSENVGYPGVEDAYRRTAGGDKILERAHNDCKSRSDFVGRNKPQTHADVMSSDAIILGRAVSYLTCLASHEPARFCQATHRTHLFAAVKDYYRLKGKMREEQVFSNAGPFAADRKMLMGPTRETFPSTSPMMLESDPNVVAVLRMLVLGGYVNRRELIGAAGGWPNDLDLVLRGIEPKLKGCG